MKRFGIFGLLLALVTLTMVGCGGSDGGSSSGTVVTGTAAKGTITGATVKVFEIISSGTTNPRTNIPRVGTTPLGTGTTAADGSYFVSIGSTVTKGGLQVVVTPGTGTTYVEEAANTSKPYTSTLRAAFGNISGAVKRGEQVVINVTPYTELGVEAISGAPTDAAIRTANGKVQSTFGSLLGGVNILTTKTYNANTVPPTGTTNFQTNYALALATISQFIVDGTPLDQLATQFLPDVQAGALSPANNNALFSEYTKFITSANNKTGVANPVTMTVTPSKTTVNVGGVDKATITANVKFNGAAVAAGSVVSFVIKAGSTAGAAVLSAATAATDASGNASVDLTAVTATKPNLGPVTVTATVYGTVIADAAPVTIADPNAPATVTLTASPATGVSGGNTPVALTATVKNSAGGNVPNGTVVTFTKTAGAGTITAVTTTTNGVATATLNSATPGVTTVTATATATDSSKVITSSPPLDVNFLDATAPFSVALTANPATGVTNGLTPVTLTADVKRLAPAGTPVADGTVVTFTITGGTGGAITAVTTTTNGLATAILNSTVANTISVTATAGAITSSPATQVPFINQPTQAIVKVATTGTLPQGTLIGGVDFTVSYPTNKGLTIAANNVAASGTAAGSLSTPNVTVAGAVRDAIINATGFSPTGEVATLTFAIAAGNFPVPADFTVALSGAGIIDTNGVAIPGLAIAIQSVTIQ